MLTIIVLPIIIGCNEPQNVETAIPLTRDDISESLDRSAESLDNMIYLTEKMTGDLEIMIENQDAIFRAVTNCISDVTCEALKQSMVLP